jgi:hypothetical protein
MSIDIIEEPMSALPEHAAIPIAFRVDRILDVIPSAEGFGTVERPLDAAYIKDYDAIEDPRDWKRFDTSKWGLLAAYSDDQRVGAQSSPSAATESICSRAAATSRCCGTFV